MGKAVAGLALADEFLCLTNGDPRHRGVFKEPGCPCCCCPRGLNIPFTILTFPVIIPFFALTGIRQLGSDETQVLTYLVQCIVLDFPFFCYAWLTQKFEKLPNPPEIQLSS